MIISKIRLKNFRQYKNELSLEFSNPNKNEKQITLIIAKNGVGKTTLLQAVRYCFYGSSSNYLNLPKSNDLINNTLEKELKDTDSADMYVELNFEHENVSYIARRSIGYTKRLGSLKPSGEEVFELSYNSKNGFKPLKQTEAIDKIKSIMPAGLSQVFMFDGERMERKVSDIEFSKELKESIIGILDIKKYDKLIDIIGYESKSYSAVGMLHNKIETTSDEEKQDKQAFEKAQSTLESNQNEYKENNRKILEIENRISSEKEIQKKAIENNNKVVERNRFDDKVKSHQIVLEEKSKNFIKDSKTIIINKLLLMNKIKYFNFINKGSENKVVFDQLHIATIEDVLEKQLCICGRPFVEHSAEFKNLEKLKGTSLPLQSAQNLSLINQLFRKSTNFEIELKNLNSKKEEISIIKKEIEDMKEDSRKLSKEIRDFELKSGLNNQSNIEEAISERENLLVINAKLELYIQAYTENLKQGQLKIDKISQQTNNNKKTIDKINLLKDVKQKLQAIKDEKDKKARLILQKNFNSILEKTINGNFEAVIEPTYQIKIIDTLLDSEVTSLLSPGQNVVVSLSFINALIKTAKDLSSSIEKNERYTVIMDAAMSQLDEEHIEKVAKNNLSSLDQLLFLSFKRQLRNELFENIKGNIGKAYVLTKNKFGHVEAEEMSINKLQNYIHSEEE
jgi:DNA sulfur modification protein DndD